MTRGEGRGGERPGEMVSAMRESIGESFHRLRMMRSAATCH
jgi:hypothetical protein